MTEPKNTPVGNIADRSGRVQFVDTPGKSTFRAPGSQRGKVWRTNGKGVRHELPFTLILLMARDGVEPPTRGSIMA